MPRREVPYHVGGRKYSYPSTGPGRMPPSGPEPWQGDPHDPRNVAIRKAGDKYHAQQECTSKVGTPAKAWKQVKGEKGRPVAKGPGKLSYKEALVRQVTENIRVKRAMKMGKAAGRRSVGKQSGFKNLQNRSRRR